MTAPALALWLAFVPVPEYYGVPGVRASYEPLVNYWADVYLVPRGLAGAMIREESHYRPEAEAYQWVEHRGRWHRTSKVLAHGIAMVTANPRHLADHLRRAGMARKDYDWRDPSDSLRVGMAFLGYLLRYFDGEYRPSVAGYNAGRDRARDWWREGRPLPRETVRYMKGVLNE
jgi:soluble lytic murein transglycosylase-like protein